MITIHDIRISSCTFIVLTKLPANVLVHMFSISILYIKYMTTETVQRCRRPNTNHGHCFRAAISSAPQPTQNIRNPYLTSYNTSSQKALPASLAILTLPLLLRLPMPALLLSISSSSSTPSGQYVSFPLSVLLIPSARNLPG
jgi:hypothetical protein